MKKKKYVILGIVTVLLVTVAGVLAYRMQQDKKKEKIKYDGYTDENQETNYITYKGEKYKYNYNLRTVLFMGIEKEGEIEDKKVGGGGQTDSLVLFAMDTEKKTTQALSVSRDTMTDIRTYDMSGEFLSTERAQLALQYAYGDGKAKSCVLTREAVSNLLYQTPVNSYVALTMEGFSRIADELGGVKITVPQDYTYINPAFKKGETITLNGKMAEQYVRYRDTNVSGSNNERMERQSQFIEALVKQLQTDMKEKKDAVHLYRKMKPYMVTDISEEELEKMINYEFEGKVEKVPGTVQKGEKYDEFIVDNEKLKEKVINMFYKHEKR
ncbi:MAG: LCP family protein [Lachnospiraceae bacterium]|nr:LCP family protein [Lachnospiraceae bacterium]